MNFFFLSKLICSGVSLRSHRTSRPFSLAISLVALLITHCALSSLPALFPPLVPSPSSRLRHLIASGWRLFLALAPSFTAFPTEPEIPPTTTTTTTRRPVLRTFSHIVSWTCDSPGYMPKILFSFLRLFSSSRSSIICHFELHDTKRHI